MSFIFSLSLYITSFFPLWISVLFLDIKNICQTKENLCTEIIGVICIIIFNAIGIVVILCKFKKSNDEIGEIDKMTAAKEQKTISSEYLLSYILPLFAFDFTAWDGAVLFLVYFIVLGYLCIKHNYFSVNIFLELLGYSFYYCVLEKSDGKGIEYFVISKNKLNTEVGKMVHLASINNEYKLHLETQ